MKAETLELHQSARQAVKLAEKAKPTCKIERILKVQNTPKTILKFEEYRDSIKAKATKLPKKYPRCCATCNELLRFYCTTLGCSLGLNGSSNHCSSIPQFNVCSNQEWVQGGCRNCSGHWKGILTTATSGKAHDCAGVSSNGHDKRAMLVCQVNSWEAEEEFRRQHGGLRFIGRSIRHMLNLMELCCVSCKLAFGARWVGADGVLAMEALTAHPAHSNCTCNVETFDILL
ncbi:unnamed protein product [Citrullus colocynthis]|uniref:Uncharacterized protein n=1 Tax=Citrullus colocynthis TaxID=252529 RepID=A0ABP0ZA50_9ROSI